jgi:hypothetical protein
MYLGFTLNSRLFGPNTNYLSRNNAGIASVVDNSDYYSKFSPHVALMHSCMVSKYSDSMGNTFKGNDLVGSKQWFPSKK